MDRYCANEFQVNKSLFVLKLRKHIRIVYKYIINFALSFTYFTGLDHQVLKSKLMQFLSGALKLTNRDPLISPLGQGRLPTSFNLKGGMLYFSTDPVINLNA